MELWMVVTGLAFLMVLGSILWIMPSKRDRRIARLRQSAILKGYKVKIMHYPFQNEAGRVEESVLDGTAYLFQNSIEELHAGWMLIKSEQPQDDAPVGWSWYIKQSSLSDQFYQHLEGLLQRYQDQILAVSIMSSGISIGWDEQGTVDDLIEFEQWSQTVKELILVQLHSVD